MSEELVSKTVEMEPKKISFGFSKITKKPNLLPVKAAKPEQQVELIKCLEGQEIKLVEEREEAPAIVIPMKENGKTSAALASLMRRRKVLLGEDDDVVEANNTKPNVDKDVDTLSDDLDKRAVREILADLQKEKETVPEWGLVLPITKPDDLPLDGAKESNLEDYESIPIAQYGLAMLRGMGWKESPTKDKKQINDTPMVRPKGMGLGADKALKPKPLLVQPEANETLEIKKQACVRILAGKYKDAYGQIEGFDDESGRVIVKLAIGGAREAFNEFLCQPVSKKEFAQYGKCINTAKYEEYKKLENEHGQIIVKVEQGNVASKSEKEEKTIIKTEKDKKDKSYNSKSSSSRLRYEEHPVSSNKCERTRSRSRSKSLSREFSSSRKHYDKKYSKYSSASSSEDSDTLEDKPKHKKSKSHRRKSKNRKKKSKRTDSNNRSDHRKSYKDSSFSDETDDERRDRHRNKKSSKKTKKSKKQRSRTPNRHRR